MTKKRSERTWVVLFAFGVVALTAFPYLIGASNSEGVFTGFLFGVEDGNSYIAKMLAGANGDWLFRSPYTAMAQSGALLYLPYLLLGKILGPAAQHAQLVLLFHLFRSISVVLLCLATYDFASLWLKDVRLRRLALFVATLGSGLGWVLLLFRMPTLLGSIPLDFYSPETFGFLAVFSIPHLVLARALLLWALVAYLQPGSIKPAWLTLLWLAIAAAHLITAVLGAGLVALHWSYTLVVSRPRLSLVASLQRLRPLIPIVVGIAPVLLFNVWVFARDSYLHSWATQNQILSPNPVHYIFAYGWLLPFAYAGWRGLRKHRPVTWIFLVLWLVALPLMLYAPVGLQRRLAEGAWVALLVLALAAFEVGGWTKRPRELWLFALAFPSTLILLLGAWQTGLAPVQPVFRATDEVAAFEQLRSIAPVDAVVLTAYQTGNALPAWAPVRVVLGHGPESPDGDRLAAQIQAFYQGRTADDPRLELLLQYGVDFVFWGPEEQRLGSWEPMDADYLKQVVLVGEYQIYQVMPEAIQ